MGESSSGQMLYMIFRNKYKNRAVGFHFSHPAYLEVQIYPCLVKEVKLSVNIIFQLCIPAAEDKNTDKTLMLLRKHGASKLPTVLLRFTDTNTWYSKPAI